jgi:hypothetical protein
MSESPGLYPLGYWAISAAAALRAGRPALIAGPQHAHVVWDVERAEPG